MKDKVIKCKRNWLTSGREQLFTFRKLCRIVCMICIALVAGSCSEDFFNNGNGAPSGEPVTLTISYKSLMPKVINVTRTATEAENQLNDLQVFIFDAASKKLKGYAFKDESLAQQGTIGNITVNTTTGDSYIYAVANIKGAPYSVEGSKNIPTRKNEWDESAAQDEVIDFTLDDFKNLKFKREGTSIDISGGFLMSGAANGGLECTIGKGSDDTGVITTPTDRDEARIKLRRIVSKINFTIQGQDNNGKTITFSPTGYEIKKIASDGSLIEGGNSVPTAFTDLPLTNYNTETPNKFMVYLPENIQKNLKKEPKTLQEREDDGQSNPKVFSYAPENGTYVVIHGNYLEKEGDVVKKSAITSYTVHLGDFGTDMTDYDVERNCEYNYTVNVLGVDRIIAEVDKYTDGSEPQPGAEGMVFIYDGGEPIQLDSHYEQRDLKFYKRDVEALIQSGGYRYQVEDMGNKSDIMQVPVTGNVIGNLNGVDDSWVEFHKEKNTTSQKNRSYPGVGNTYNLKDFFQHLYGSVKTPGFWTGTGDDAYVSFTCYFKENYHESLTWDKYVNKPDRTIYIANTVSEPSKDGRSQYAHVQYAISQHSIQTIYNTNLAGSLVAFGCETIREEEGKSNITGEEDPLETNTSAWNGRGNMKSTISFRDINSKWGTVNRKLNDLRYACMSRNRDLNGDGTIDDNEIRWYCPAIDQYGALWIGEAAIDGKARLFQKKTSQLDETTLGTPTTRKNFEHYYANTYNTKCFWAEEGMATGNGDDSKFVRCIRTLESGKEGLREADKYYDEEKAKKDGIIDLSKLNQLALRTTYQEDELQVRHLERPTEGSGTSSDINRPAAKFEWASNRVTHRSDGSPFGMTDVVEGRVDCSGYHETSNDKWRVPNQRELCLMHMIGGGEASNACRTMFSNTNVRYSWYDIGTVITMCQNKKSDGESYIPGEVQIRCVRDKK